MWQTQVGTHHLGMVCVPSLPLPLPSLFCGLFSPGQPEVNSHCNCRKAGGVSSATQELLPGPGQLDGF